MAKFVYLIASHTNPEQVVRLVKTLRQGSPAAEIVIRHDYDESYLDPAAFAGMANIHFIKDDICVSWGDFSIVSMILNAIEWITTHLKFDWLVFISGQDYPIQPLGQIEKFLEHTPYDGFISGVALENAVKCGPVECSINGTPGRRCPDCLTRYYYQYYDPYYHHLPVPVKKSLQTARRFLENPQSLLQIRSVPGQFGSRLVVGIRTGSFPFTSKFQCYKGSQWFSLNRQCVQYIREFVGKNNQVVKYYQRTLIPDESFFQTILYNNPALKICNDNKRFIYWPDHQARSPQVLKVADFDRIVSSKQHFARKFDLKVDAAILDLLDKYIIERGLFWPIL